MFDKGAFSVKDNFDLIGAELGKLTVLTSHKLDLENIRYHRESHGYN